MDIALWLYKIGLPHLAEAFKAEGIEADVLSDLTSDDLKELGVTRLGERKRLLKAIEALGATALPTLEGSPAESPTSLSVVNEAQRRQLTVMFCDLVGSTPLSTILDPEDLHDLIRSYQSACRKVILTYNGFISRYVGDGILVLFGYPQANEHSAESAVRASLQIIDSMAALNRDVKQHGVELKVRIGIATGPVVVGDLIGEGASEQAAVVGETPNLAARLQGLAEPDNVVISNATRKLAGRLFNYVEMGPQSLKGIVSPVTSWRVLGELSENWRYKAKQGGYATALVNRHTELATLMQNWTKSKAGVGQAVVITAEAGMGKSRLAYAVREQLANEEHYLLSMQGVSFRRDSALFPVIESMRAAARINQSDSPEERYRKLRELTHGESVDGIETLQLIAPLFSLDTSDEFDALEIGPNQLKLLTHRAIWQRVTKLAGVKPVLALVEDYHWIDPTSREFLDLVINDVANTRVLLIVTQRTEYTADLEWSRHPQATLLTLDKLGEDYVNQLVLDTIAASILPNHLKQEIYRKTDGNPLFVEELTYMLLEQKRATDSNDGSPSSKLESGIPSTLQDLLFARLDQVGPARRLAQHASCYGRTFSRRELKIISPLQSEELTAQLKQLLNSGMVQEVAGSDERYEFKHALVQDAAYESQLKSTRVSIHEKIANHFERLLCDDEPEILAHHFGLAGNTQQERIYWHKAARQSMGSGAFVEAINYFNRALQALSKEGREPRKVEQSNTADHAAIELELLVEAAVPSTLTKGWAAEEVGRAYERAHELSQQQGSSPLLFAALSGIFRYYLVTGNYKLVEQIALKDLERAEQSGDESVVMEFALHPGIVCYYTGRPEEALPYLRRTVKLYDLEKHREHINIYGQCTAVVALSHQAKALVILGRPADAFELCRESGEIAEQSGHVFSVAWGISNHASSHILLENPTATLELATRMIEISSKADFVNWIAQGLVWQGWAIAHGADSSATHSNKDNNDSVQRGLTKIQEGIAIWQMTGTSLMQPFYYVLLAQCHLLAGQLDDAEDALTKGLEIIDKTGELWPKPLWQLTTMNLAVAKGRQTNDRARDELHAFILNYSDKGEWLWAIKGQRFLAELDGCDLPQQTLHEIAAEHSNLSDYLPLADLIASLRGTSK